MQISSTVSEKSFFIYSAGWYCAQSCTGLLGVNLGLVLCVVLFRCRKNRPAPMDVVRGHSNRTALWVGILPVSNWSGVRMCQLVILNGDESGIPFVAQ